MALCISAGTVLGRFLPQIADALAKVEIAHISIPITICLFAMIYPIMVQISFEEIKRAFLSPKPIALTLVANWVIKPFTMALFAWFFLSVVFGQFLTPEQTQDYRPGLILLGVAPYAAMVLIWSYLAQGNEAYSGYDSNQLADNGDTVYPAGMASARYFRHTGTVGNDSSIRSHIYRYATDSRLSNLKPSN